MKQNFPRSRQTDIVVQELLGEVLIYDLNVDKAFCLNETSALVWQECDGSKSISEISRTISRKLNSTIDEDFVWLALDQLKKENLLDNPQELVSAFNGLSRREAIKRVGLASMIALPIVTSLIAPTAAAAQSGLACIATNDTCLNGDTCCVNTASCVPLSTDPTIGTCIDFGPTA